MLRLGSIASNEEVRARWGYAEIVSPRVGQIYRNNPDIAEPVGLALDGVPFEQVPLQHHPSLAAAATSVRASYAKVVEQHRRFRLTGWTKSQVNDVFVDAFFNTPRQDLPMRFRDFVIWNRHVGIGGKLHRFDPRLVADQLPPGTAPLTDEAPIVVSAEPGFMVDGYLRSLLFMRDATPDAILPVWIGLGD